MWNMLKLYLILHNIRSVENVGSIFRTADGAGVEKIFLTGYTPAPIDRFGRKRKDIAKVALGAEENIPYESVGDIKKLITRLKKEKVNILALEQDGKSVDYKKASKKIKEKLKEGSVFVLVLGNEVEGINKSILKKADMIIEIPLRGKKESLNVSVAAGIAIFELVF